MALLASPAPPRRPTPPNAAAISTAWLTAFKSDAVAAGVPPEHCRRALTGVTPSAGILKLDRNQHYFKQSFETYRAKRVTAGMIDAAGEDALQSPPS